MLKKTLRSVFAVAGVTALAALSFQGCHTLQGAGQDIEDTGQSLEDAAE